MYEHPLRNYHCVESVQIRSFFWSAFSCIRTADGDLRNKSPYSVRMQENKDQKKTPYLGTFHAVNDPLKFWKNNFFKEFFFEKQNHFYYWFINYSENIGKAFCVWKFQVKLAIVRKITGSWTCYFAWPIFFTGYHN